MLGRLAHHKLAVWVAQHPAVQVARQDLEKGRCAAAAGSGGMVGSQTGGRAGRRMEGRVCGRAAARWNGGAVGRRAPLEQKVDEGGALRIAREVPSPQMQQTQQGTTTVASRRSLRRAATDHAAAVIGGTDDVLDERVESGHCAGGGLEEVPELL